MGHSHRAVSTTLQQKRSEKQFAAASFMGKIVNKTKTMRKPINFLIVSMVMSDLLYPIVLIPRSIQGLYIKDSWPIGCPLGQILYKQVFFLTPRVVSIGSSRGL